MTHLTHPSTPAGQARKATWTWRSTERYAHLADDPIRAAADRAAGRIAARLAAGGEDKGRTADVALLGRVRPVR